MTNEEYRSILEKLGLPIIGAAPVLGVGPRTAQGYAADRPIPGPVARLMQLLSDCPTLVQQLKDMD